jgi:hypothetical protein
LDFFPGLIGISSSEELMMAAARPERGLKVLKECEYQVFMRRRSLTGRTSTRLVVAMPRVASAGFVSWPSTRME